MLTISHLTIISSVIGIGIALYFGAKAGEKPSIFFMPLIYSLVLAISVAMSTWFIFLPSCLELKLCAQTHDMNIYHPIIPVIYFPVFWLAYLVGLKFMRNPYEPPSSASQANQPVAATDSSGLRYAGFWQRFLAYWIDVAVLLPLVGAAYYFGEKSRLFHLYWFVPGLMFSIFFHVYLVKRFGGTPGKLLLKNRITYADPPHFSHSPFIRAKFACVERPCAEHQPSAEVRWASEK